MMIRFEARDLSTASSRRLSKAEDREILLVDGHIVSASNVNGHPLFVFLAGDYALQACERKAAERTGRENGLVLPVPNEIRLVPLSDITFVQSASRGAMSLNDGEWLIHGNFTSDERDYPGQEGRIGFNLSTGKTHFIHASHKPTLRAWRLEFLNEHREVVFTLEHRPDDAD